VPVAGGHICLLFSQKTTIMDDARPKRRDLVENFPKSFTYSGLIMHFAQEYRKVMGEDAPKVVVHTLTHGFQLLWKKCRNKKLFFSTSKSRKWLDTVLPRPEEALPVVAVARAEGKTPPANSICALCAYKSVSQGSESFQCEFVTFVNNKWAQIVEETLY
jgi:hypothetical protein